MTYRDNPLQENIQSISKADVLFAKALDVNPCRKPWVKTPNHEETLESNTVGLWDPQNTKELHGSRPWAYLEVATFAHQNVAGTKLKPILFGIPLHSAKDCQCP